MGGCHACNSRASQSSTLYNSQLRWFFSPLTTMVTGMKDTVLKHDVMCLCLCCFLGRVSASQISSFSNNSDTNRYFNGKQVFLSSLSLWSPLASTRQGSRLRAGRLVEAGSAGAGWGLAGTSVAELLYLEGTEYFIVTVTFLSSSLHSGTDAIRAIFNSH